MSGRNYNTLKMASSKDLNAIGFVDITFRDRENMTEFKVSRERAGTGLNNFLKFLDDKYSIKVLPLPGLEKYLEKKYNIRGFSAHEFEGFSKNKRRKNDPGTIDNIPIDPQSH